MRKVVYILGLGHSGSTILDMALGCHPSIVGLGEVSNPVHATQKDLHCDRFTTLRCSCGRTVLDCDFWAGARKVLLEHCGTDIDLRYQQILDYFFGKFGDGKIMVDSSKEPRGYLQFLNETVDLYVIFLVRDFRSWVYSRRSRHGKSAIGLAWRWFRGNVTRKRYLTANGFKFIQVGYEEIALFPEMMLRRICQFLNIEWSPYMLEPWRSNSHIVSGNVARLDRQKRSGFAYDGRWLTSLHLNLLAPMFLPLFKWNTRNVYSNFLKGTSRAFGVRQADFEVFGDVRKEQIRQRTTQGDPQLPPDECPAHENASPNL